MHIHALVGVACLSVAGIATAQNSNTTTPANPGAEPAAGETLQEIVVTAERRTEDINKTPLAITAISGNELTQHDVVNVVQLQYLAPSMQVTQTAQGIYVSLRGISTTDRTSKGQPGIQFNTDGIPVNQPEEQALAMFDVQRVEVLSGPQGTLYGKSSTGGAINVITNAPQLGTESGQATVEFGNYDTKRINGYINEPIGDDWAFRLAGASNSRLGYMQLIGASTPSDAPDDEGTLIGRASLLGKLSDALQVRLTALAGRIADVGSADSLIKINADNYVTGTVYGVANPIPSYVRDDVQRFNGQLDLDVGAVHAAYIGSYSHYATDNNQSSYGLSTSSQPNGILGAVDESRELVRDSYDTTYHELRFSNKNEGRLDWVAGVNYYYEHIAEDGHGLSLATPSPGDPGDCTPGPVTFGSDVYCDIYEAGGNFNDENQNNLLNYTTEQSYGIYAHGVYALTPDWHLTLGLREGTDKVTRVGAFHISAYELNSQGTLCIDGEECPYGFAPGTNPFAPFSTASDNDTGHSTYNKLVWNIGSDYAFTPSQFGYFRIATGYKAGGFNDFSPTNNNRFAPYAPESMTSYEVGYKLHSSASLDYTAALYYYDYSNEQVNGSFLFLVNGLPQEGVAVTVGAPTQLYGMENTLRWTPTRNDQIDAEADFEQSKYTSNFMVGVPTAVDFIGKQLDNTPQDVFTLGYTHIFDLTNGARFEAHVDSRENGSYKLTNFATGVQYTQGSFTRSNADLTYVSSNGRLSTTVFVTNIENKVQVTGAVANPYTPPAVPNLPYQSTGEVSEPRFWGMRATVSF